MAKINIVISSNGSTKQVDSTGVPTNNQTEKGMAPTSKLNDVGAITKSVAASQLTKAGLSALKSNFNYAKNNYGNFTGDYVGQAKIDSVFQSAENMFNFGSSIVNGAIVGGAPGAMIGALVGTIQMDVQYQQTLATANLQNTKANQLANFNASRLGVILSNGNR